MNDTYQDARQGEAHRTEVPINKTTTALTSLLDRMVGEAIAAWEKVRDAMVERAR